MASRSDSRGARRFGLLVLLPVAAGFSGGSGGGSNTAPVVDAGVDQNLVLPEVLRLRGSFTDDGLPNGRANTSWSVRSGPGTVLFVNRLAPSTLATVSAAGQYVLRLSVDDGEFRTHDDVTFDVADLPGNEITLDPSTTHQTITGWEATADAHQDLSPAFDTYKDQLFDLAVNDLGITRVRLEVRSGVENDKDYWTMWRRGQIPYRDWRSHRYSTVNDNGNPGVTDSSRFHFSELDSIVTKVVLPLRQRVEANGEPFHINVCYVAFVKQIGTGLGYDHYDANEYAEFVETTYRHLSDTHGIVPDSWEILLEPDNVPGWFGYKLGNAMAVLGPRLIAAGFTPRFVAPSSASMALAVQQFDQLASVPNALDHMVELSYHRYAGVSTRNLQLIQDRAQAYGLDTAHLEHIGADYSQLHDDLKIGGNSAWSQYVLATLTSLVPDDGTAYYVLDDSGPNAPVIKMGSRTHHLRQYIKYVRPGSVRIEATTSNAHFDPVTFVRLDGGFVTVVKAQRGGTFYVRDLPAGTYGISYTTPVRKGFDAADAVLIPGQILTATIPQPGVITIYSKSQQAEAGDLLVTSWNNDTVLRYDGTSGAFLGTFVTAGSGGLANPHSACHGPDGNLYVTSFANDRVLRYDGTSGAFLGAFVTPGSGGLDGPTSAEFGLDGQLYVSSFATPGVLRYDGTTGAFLGVFIGPGNGLVNAESGHFAPNRRYYLANGAGNNVLEYDGTTGAFLRVFAAGTGRSEMHEAIFGPNGNLFATAFANRRVNEYDGTSGAFVRTFVGGGNGLIGVHGMLFPGDGFFYVAAFNSDQVNRYDAVSGAFDSVFVAEGSGGLSGPISLTRVPEPAAVGAYGCGVNPAGSLTVSGSASLGSVLDFRIDNPLGTQIPGSLSMLLISSSPNPNYPCGTLFPGLGMSGPGASGELLVQGGRATLGLHIGPLWMGMGRPASIPISIPPRVSLLGAVGYAQGALRDFVGPVGWGLTNGLEVRIGL